MADRVGDFLSDFLGQLWQNPSRPPDRANLDRMRLELNRITSTPTAGPSVDKGADHASATALVLGLGTYFHVTGTTTITSISARLPGEFIWLEFDGALTLTHNATNLILQGGANLTTAAGDVLGFVSEGGGNWREITRRLAAASTNALLDGSKHTDTVAQAVSRGSIVYGNSTPKWDELTIGTARKILESDGTDVSWQLPNVDKISIDTASA